MNASYTSQIQAADRADEARAQEAKRLRGAEIDVSETKREEWKAHLNRNDPEFPEAAGAGARMTDPALVRKFILGGRAVFTLVSTATQRRFTFKVTQPKAAKGQPVKPHFVALLTGPNNTNDFSYLGAIFSNSTKVAHTRASKVTPDAPSFKAVDWVYGKVSQGVLPATVEFWHEGRCCVCGRALTDPQSIALGTGPICGGR